MKKQVLALVAGMGLFASALTVEAVSADALRTVGSGATGVMPASGVTTPPEKPGDGDDPPDAPGGGGETPPDKPGGGGSGDGSEDSVILTGVLQLDSGSESYDGGTLASTNSDENVILAQTNGTTLTVSNYTLNKSGDCTSEDNSNFFAVNAVVAAKSAAKICIDKSALNSQADGANGLFASGDGSTIYAYDCTITSTKDSSRGLDATYEGTVIASKLTIDTSGSHCAALATDRGDGSISVTDSTLATAGQGSPLVYSTGVIEVNGVTGTATGAQIAGIEGLSTIRIWNSELSGSGEKASEPVANGVIIYQSGSGDSTEGTATFEVSDSTLKSAISGGAMFYITHSAAVITVRKTALDFDADGNCLILAAGNDGEHGWGTVGSNGAQVVFTAIDQTLKGTISVDGISTLDLYLANSTYTGTFDTTNSADGVNVFIGSNSVWTVTESCTLDTLTVADGATIADGDGKTVSIVNASGTKLVSGTGDLTVTVSAYASEQVEAPHAITDFEIDRTAFEAMYGTSQDPEGGTYYFKPHPPENAIVKVKHGETVLLPDRDHKYWVNALGITVTIIYATETGYFFADGTSTMSRDVVFDTDKMDIYPLDGTVVVKAQARSGSTYYPTLREAVDAAQARSKITLNDNVTLEETLMVTNSITLDLATNVVTLGSALTQAFHFTAGATVSNGTIVSSRAANAEGSVLMRFTDCKATLKDLTVDGRGYESVVAHDSNTPSEEKYAAGRVGGKVTCDGLVLTGNGCLLSVDYAAATLSNACSFAADDTLASFGGAHEAAVSCSGNGSVTIADGTYAAPKALQSGEFGGEIVVNGGTFSGQIYSWMAVGAHAALETNGSYRARFALNGGTYADATLAFAYADARALDVFTRGDGVAIAAPSGYAWEDNVLVEGPVAPGVTSDPYGDAQTATNAVAKINADKAANITVPTGVGDDLKAAYLARVAATVTGDNRVVVDLTPAAAADEQAVVDAAVSSETVVESLTRDDASAKATLATTTPGLYYWVEGGTDVNAVTASGPAELSTNGGSVELAKPTLDATKGQAFFRISAGVAAPVRSDAD